MRPTVIRIDSAPEFASLVNDELLSRYRMSIELGRVKTRTKTQWQRKQFGNSKAKSPIINHKVAPQWPSLLQYSIPAADQYTSEQMPVSDHKLIIEQHLLRPTNHTHSELSKSPGCTGGRRATHWCRRFGIGETRAIWES